jgi:putative hydrolase of HD superfamily
MVHIGQDYTDGGNQALVDFTFEIGQLREEARHGWLRIYENPESVAEHTHRAACFAYILAIKEGYDNPCLVATMVLFHDNHEVRTGDQDIVQRRYTQVDEDRAAYEQVNNLGEIGRSIFNMWHDVENKSTKAGIIAKDAEVLEMVFTARELVIRGNTDAQAWIDSTRLRLKTETAKEILEIVNQADPCEWWKKLQSDYSSKLRH